MVRKSRGKGEDEKKAVPVLPGDDDFNGASVARKVRNECLSHPFTVFPFVGSALAVFWSVLFNADPVSIGVIIAGIAIGIIGFAYNYIVDGERRVDVHMQKLLAAVKQHVHIELDNLRQESEELGFAEGVKEANELATDYANLIGYLEKRPQEQQFRILAEKTFKEGVSILAQAVAVYRAAVSIDIEVLKEEVATWREERKGLDDSNARAKSLDRQIDSHDQRIALFDSRQETLDELVAQVNEIEGALQKTYLELVELGDQDATKLLHQDGGAAKRLESAVRAARRVEEKLRGGTSPEDAARRAEYVRLGEESRRAKS